MRWTLLFTIFVFFAYVTPLSTAMTGGNYEIYADGLSITDGLASTGGSFSLLNTGGEFFATTTLGGTLELRGGFQAMERAGLGLTLSKQTITLGELSRGAVATDSLTATVTSESGSAVTLTIAEDGNLRDNAGNTIDDVGLGGTVQAGTEGYGIRTDANGNLGGAHDTPISGSVSVMTIGAGEISKQTAVTFRASIGGQSRAGTYSHTVTFTATANP